MTWGNKFRYERENELFNNDKLSINELSKKKYMPFNGHQS